MRVTRIALIAVAFAAAAAPLRAEYIVLKNGQRFHVTGYQLLGDKYHLQLASGSVDVAVAEVVSIDPEEDFVSVPQTAAPVAMPDTSPYGEFVKAAAARYAVDAELIRSVIAAESNFDPKAISSRNARGLMQLLPETAARYGVRDIFDPGQNIDAGTHYLSELLKRYNNDLVLALAAYNAGPERVEQYGNVPPYRETVSYVRRVKKNYEKSKSAQPAAPSPADLLGQKPAAAPQTSPTASASPTPPPPSSPN